MWWSWIIFLSFSSTCFGNNANETETFSIAVTPKLFNWTYQEFDKQYVYHPSIITKPDLPNWLHYVYSIRHQSGFIYGTPPLGQKDLTLEIVALNREDYETRRLVIPVHIKKKANLATHNVQLKIDNLNVEDLLDEYRMEKLKDIFRKRLWKECGEDLYVTFMASAIEMGARLPLRPNEGEGVVLKLGSHKEWSAELIQLQEEVRPLSKMSWCPRDFKRTTVERLFRDAGFNLDWCTFRLVDSSSATSYGGNNKNNRMRLPSEEISHSHVWLPSPPTKASVPERSYALEFLFTIFIPFLIVILVLTCLGTVFCFQHDERYCCSVPQTGNKGEYQSDVSGMTLANTGTSDVLLSDDVCDKRASPSNTLKPNPTQTVEVDYNRPQPPPYLGSNTNTLVQRHKPSLEEEVLTKRAHCLEESLQMLNEANISNRTPYHVKNILYPEQAHMRDILMGDVIGGNAVDEDYILIKPDNEPLTVRRDHKDIRNRHGVNNGNLKGFGHKI